MNWQRKNRYWSESGQGYRISATAGMGECWLFTAWAPEDGCWREGLKIHYRRGEQVPRPRELLGVFDDAEQAKAQCERHSEGRHAAA